MKIINSPDLMFTDREVHCPKGGFISYRMLLEDDGMGYTMTRTIIPPNGPQKWHYKNHLESCYCVSGRGVLKDVASDEEHMILPGMVYVLDKNDEHIFEALETVELICVFNPPLKGREVHKEDGSYEA